MADFAVYKGVLIMITPKKRKFSKEYLIDLNATKAADRSGFSKKTAYSQGQRLLKDVEVQKLIQKEMEKRSKRTKINQDRVLKELAMIGFSDLRNYVDIEKETGVIRAKTFEEMPEGESRVIQSIEENRAIKEDAKGEQVTVYDKIKFKLHDKLKALELIGKHLGMFVDKFDVGDELKKILVERIITVKRPPE